MVKIIGVRFRNAGKVYYFDPKSWQINTGDPVIVETARGIEYGTAVGGVREVPDDKIVQPLREVVRLATDEDNARAIRNREKEKEAMRICREKIQKHGLEMKLIDAEYTFDNNKVLFYFTADGRIDFRELVKDLAAVFRMRIELRQVGVRDETKLLGGIGICGRVLCCNSYLSDFAPVSIRMAKEQNLSLNPTKISGACGRLMCCLKNEEETYEYLNSRLPATGDTVTTADGRKGEVQSVNVLRQRVKVIFEENEEKELEEFDVGDLTFRPRRKKEKGGKNKEKEKENGHSADTAETPDEKELRDLEALEEQKSSRETASAPAKKRNFDHRAAKKAGTAHTAPENHSVVDGNAENGSARATYENRSAAHGSAESKSRKGKAGRETHAHGS